MAARKIARRAGLPVRVVWYIIEHRLLECSTSRPVPGRAGRARAFIKFDAFWIAVEATRYHRAGRRRPVLERIIEWLDYAPWPVRPARRGWDQFLRGESNLRPASPNNLRPEVLTATPVDHFAQTFARESQDDADLNLIREHWHDLPEVVRAGTVAMVRVARNGRRPSRGSFRRGCGEDARAERSGL